MSSNGWKEFSIGEVCTLGDGAHTKVKRLDTGVLYLTSKNIKDGKLILNDVSYISKEDFNRLFSSSQNSVRNLQYGDVLIGIIGTIGNAYVYKRDDKFGVSSSVAILRPDVEKIDSKYLYFILSSRNFQRMLSNVKGGSVQGYTNLPLLRSLPITIPPILEQKSISDTLSCLDDKIEINNRINKNLEEIAQAIFKHWFVDFEFPNEKGNPYKSSGGKLVESELGEIPESWNVGALYDISDIVYGAPFSSGNFNVTGEGLPLIRIRDLKTGTPAFYTEEEHNKATIIKKGQILIGMDAEFTPTIWSGREGYLNQRVCLLMPRKKYVHDLFLYELIKPYMRFFESVKVGTTVIHLGKKDFDSIRVICPEMNILTQFYSVVDPLHKMIINIMNEKYNLEKTKDILLPKLLSGEIELPIEEEA